MALDVPQFSVVMPAYNRQKLIAASVQSVLDQTLMDFELIVVDDGSGDHTLDVLSRISDPRLTVLAQSNSGPGAARNKGIGQARGRYVAFLDSDDLFMPWTLQTYAQLIEQNQQPAMLFGRMQDFRQEDELAPITQENLIAHAHGDYLLADGFDTWVGSSVICVRRDVLLASGGFCNAKVNQEDCDLWLRIGSHPGFVAIEKPTCAGRRWHDGNVSHQMQKNIDGADYLLNQYADLAYSQKPEHRARLHAILARHVRPVSLDCIKHGHRREALRFYLRTMGWNLKQGRVRYLLGFWLRFVMGRGSR